MTVVLAVLEHLEDVGGSAGAGRGQGQGQAAAHGHHRPGEPQVKKILVAINSNPQLGFLLIRKHSLFVSTTPCQSKSDMIKRNIVQGTMDLRATTTCNDAMFEFVLSTSARVA